MFATAKVVKWLATCDQVRPGEAAPAKCAVPFFPESPDTPGIEQKSGHRKETHLLTLARVDVGADHCDTPVLVWKQQVQQVIPSVKFKTFAEQPFLHGNGNTMLGYFLGSVKYVVTVSRGTRG